MDNRYAVAFINTNTHKNVAKDLLTHFPKHQIDFITPSYSMEGSTYPFFESYMFITWKGKSTDFIRFENKCNDIIKFLRVSNNDVDRVVALLSEEELEGLNKLSNDSSNLYDSYLKYQGSRVRFTNGAFKNYEGLLVKVYPVKSEGKVAVKLFGRVIQAVIKLDDLDIDFCKQKLVLAS